jgi:hypothetical protein
MYDSFLYYHLFEGICFDRRRRVSPACLSSLLSLPTLPETVRVSIIDLSSLN